MHKISTKDTAHLDKLSYGKETLFQHWKVRLAVLKYWPSENRRKTIYFSLKNKNLTLLRMLTLDPKLIQTSSYNICKINNKKFTNNNFQADLHDLSVQQQLGPWCHVYEPLHSEHRSISSLLMENWYHWMMLTDY